MITSTAGKPRPAVKPPIRRSARNVVLFLAAGVAAVVAVIVLAAGLYVARSAYQAGHQSSPTAAVNGLLDAALSDRDPASADKYLCPGGTIRRDVRTLIGRITGYERDTPGARIRYTWDTPRAVTRHGDSATVVAVVQPTSTDGTSVQAGERQSWRFDVRDRGGWHVCRMTGWQ
jgi:hypothetical protein